MTKESKYDEFMGLRKGVAQYTGKSAQMVAEDARARLNAYNGGRKDLADALGDKSVAEKLQGGESLDSIYAGLIQTSDENSERMFKANLENIVKDAPNKQLGEVERILSYDANEDANKEAGKAHKKIIDLSKKLSEDPQKVVDEGIKQMYETKKKAIADKLKAKFKYADSKSIDGFADVAARVGTQDFDPKAYLGNVMKQAQEDFKKTFKDDSSRQSYGRAALLRTARRLVKENKIGEAMAYVESLNMSLDELKRRSK